MAFSLACLEIRSRNEEAINSTRNRIYLLKVLLPTLLTSILFICFWIDLGHVLATTGNMPAVAGFMHVQTHENSRASIPEKQFLTFFYLWCDYYIRDQKSNLHGSSFQTLPKINRMLITRPICTQWKFTTPDHCSLLIKILVFFNHSVVFTCSKVNNAFKR